MKIQAYSNEGRKNQMNKKKIEISQIVINIILILMCCAMLYPLLLCLGVSFSDERDILTYGYKLIPEHFDLSGYKYVFKNSKMVIDAYAVTIFVSVASTLLTIVTNSLMAYPLSRREFKYRKFLNYYFYFTCLFSGGLVPQYILYTQYLHLDDTIWVFIIPCLVGAWTIFYYRASFQSIPEEIVESAVLDGASEWRILFTFMIPLSKPVIATMSLQFFMAKWNDWYTSMLYINDRQELILLQYLLQKIMLNMNLLKSGTTSAQYLQSAQIPSETARMAMMFVVAGPALVIFPFFQKYFVKGMIVGSVKG